MAQNKGSMAQLLGGIVEATYGTTPVDTSAAVKLPIVSSGVKANQPIVRSNVIRSDRSAPDFRYGKIDVAGPYVIPVDAINFGYWLQMLLGTPTVSGAGPYAHEFKVRTAINSWVLEEGYTDGGDYRLLNGVKVQSMSLDFDAAADAPLQATVNIMAAKETLSTSSMDGTPTTQTYSEFALADAAITEGGSPIATVQKLTVSEITNSLDPSGFFIGGAGVRGQLSEGFVYARGTLKALFEDWTLYNKAVNGTESSIIVTLTSGTNVLVLEFNEIKYQRNSPSIPGPEGIYVELPWEAFYNNHGDASVVVATLTNGLAAYPGET